MSPFLTPRPLPATAHFSAPLLAKLHEELSIPADSNSHSPISSWIHCDQVFGPIPPCHFAQLQWLIPVVSSFNLSATFEEGAPSLKHFLLMAFRTPHSLIFLLSYWPLLSILFSDAHLISPTLQDTVLGPLLCLHSLHQWLLCLVSWF